MGRSIVAAGAVALAGVLMAVSTDTSDARGMARIGFHGLHRPAAHILHRDAVRAPAHREAIEKIEHRAEHRDVDRRARFFGPQLHRFVFRHHHRALELGFPVTVGGYYVPDQEYAPATYAPDLGPACRSQDYEVPDSNGDLRTVRVLRC